VGKCKVGKEGPLVVVLVAGLVVVPAGMLETLGGEETACEGAEERADDGAATEMVVPLVGLVLTEVSKVELRLVGFGMVFEVGSDPPPLAIAALYLAETKSAVIVPFSFEK